MKNPSFSIDFTDQSIIIKPLNNQATEIYIYWNKYSGQKDSNILFLSFLLSCSNKYSQTFNKNKVSMKLEILNKEIEPYKDQ